MTINEWIEAGKPWNNFILGDCMDLMGLLSDNYFDLAIVDPPYGIGDNWNKSKSHQFYNHKNNFNNSIPDAKYFEELFRISKNQIIWGGNYYSYVWPSNNLIIWDKVRDYSKTFMSECEIAWHSFNIPIRKFKFQWDGGKKENETGIKTIHPHQKPIALYQWILQNYAKPGDKIFDSHIGSASSLIACMEEKFDYIGIEKDIDYYKSASERIEIYKSQGKLF